MVKRTYRYILLSTLILGASMGAGTNVFATDPEVDLSVTVNPSLTLSVSSNSVNLPITPDADGEYNTTNFTITSATNNMYGYTLTMSTEDDHTYLESTTVNPTTGTKPQIQSLASSQDGISAATFEAATAEANGLNRWGIAIGSGNYNAVTSPKEVKKTTTNNASGADTTTVNIAAKLNLEVSAGTYKNKFILQMVANPNVGTLEDAYQMAGKTKKTVGNESYYSIQDMNPGICAAAAQSNLQVVDERDNTIYWIGKLADERCWLLDNLALDAVADGSSLTPSNTNATQDAIDNFITDSVTASQVGWSTYAVGYSSSKHTAAPYINIARKDVISSDALSAAGEWKVGVYYNYCAASIGTFCFSDGEGVDEDDSSAIDVKNDICPANWRMPTGGLVSSVGTTAGGGEYQALYDAYSGDSGSGEGSKIRNYRVAFRLSLPGGSGNGWSNNSCGLFWSSTYNSGYSMNSLRVDVPSGSSITPFFSSQYGIRREGEISIRCIAKTGTEPAPSGN